MKKIYVDGSSKGNPGVGGWAVVVMNEDETAISAQFFGTENNVTNNRMELKALLYALEYADENPDETFIIYSDSSYVVNSCNEWMRSWAANNWLNSKKQVVENVDYMKAIWFYLSKDFFNADIQKCKGHNGELGNELADALAQGNNKKYKELIEYWFEK